MRVKDTKLKLATCIFNGVVISSVVLLMLGVLGVIPETTIRELAWSKIIIVWAISSACTYYVFKDYMD